MGKIKSAPSSGVIEVSSLDDIEKVEARIRSNAVQLIRAIKDSSVSEMALFERLRFQEFGRHPISDEPLNAVEQLNESWTFLVALSATRQLLKWHPDAGGFRLAPGAHMAQALDVMSVRQGLVGAETFAAVRGSNNKKLNRDIAKMRDRTERHRYVMFASSDAPDQRTQRLLEKEKESGVQVWRVDVGLGTDVGG